MIGEELGRDPEELFASFDDEPIASASIAQVHARDARATSTARSGARPMPAGTRGRGEGRAPRCAARSVADICARRGASWRWLRALGSTRRRLDLTRCSTSSPLAGASCDLRNEGRVADRFAFDFRDDPLVVVPRIVWTRTTRRVLTMERMDGWRLTELTRPSGRRRRAGPRGARRDRVHAAGDGLGRYHADLHPANLFVTPDNRIAYLDFGIVGRTHAARAHRDRAGARRARRTATRTGR